MVHVWGFSSSVVPCIPPKVRGMETKAAPWPLELALSCITVQWALKSPKGGKGMKKWIPGPREIPQQIFGSGTSLEVLSVNTGLGVLTFGFYQVLDLTVAGPILSFKVKVQVSNLALLSSCRNSALPTAR